MELNDLFKMYAAGLVVVDIYPAWQVVVVELLRLRSRSSILLKRRLLGWTSHTV